jgi:hypothetical protein
MNTEEAIRQALEKRREAKTVWIPQQADMNHDLSPEAANDYLISWVERVVFKEHLDDKGFYCTVHRRFYWQPSILGEEGLSCHDCHKSQVPPKED